MVFTPVSANTSAFAPPAPMSEFVWAFNPLTGAYDIQNEFTPPTNQGNLMVIQSKILITLGTFQGEWDADQRFGLPEAAIIDNNDNIDILTQIFVGEVLTVQNVKTVVINAISYTAPSRIFSSNFNANTVFGTVTVNVGESLP